MEKETAIVLLDEAAGVTIEWRRLLRQPIEEMSVREKAEALSLCDLVSKALGVRAAALKPTVRELVMGEAGTQHTAKTRKAVIGDVEIHVTSKEGRVSVNETALRLLLMELDLPLDTVFDQVPKLNESRLEQLIASGRLTADQIGGITIEGKAPAPSLMIKKHVLGLSKQKLLEG